MLISVPLENMLYNEICINYPSKISSKFALSYRGHEAHKKREYKVFIAIIIPSLVPINNIDYQRDLCNLSSSTINLLYRESTSWNQ